MHLTGSAVMCPCPRAAQRLPSCRYWAASGLRAGVRRRGRLLFACARGKRAMKQPSGGERQWLRGGPVVGRVGVVLQKAGTCSIVRQLAVPANVQRRTVTLQGNLFQTVLSTVARFQRGYSIGFKNYRRVQIKSGWIGFELRRYLAGGARQESLKTIACRKVND